MIFDLNETEAKNLILNTETTNAKTFINDCLNYNVSIFEVMEIIETYLNEFEPLHIQDVRDFINGGGWNFFNKNELKDIDTNDYYILNIKPGLFFLIE